MTRPILVVTLISTCCLPGLGWSADVPAPLTMDAAIAVALRQNGTLELQELESRIAAARLRQSGGAWDWRLNAKAGIDHSPASITSTSGLGPDATQTVDTTSQNLSLSRQLREGVAVEAGVELTATRTRTDGTTTYPTENRSRPYVGGRVPLLRDRGFGSANATEQAAREALRGSEYDGSHARAGIAVQTAIAYWGVIAANERLAEALAAEERLAALATLTRELVAAGAIPSSQLTTIIAQQATAGASRVVEENGVFTARNVLLTVLGSEADSTLGEPTETLPEVSAAVPGTLASLYRIAKERRTDLRAANARLSAAGAQIQAADASSGPSLDLVGQVWSAGLAEQDGLGGSYDSLGRRVTGPGGSVALQFTHIFSDNVAGGVIDERQAQARQAKRTRLELERTIGLGIAKALADVSTARAARDQVIKAAEAFTAALDNQRTLYKAQQSTLLDVITVEDRLSGIRLSLIDARRRLAESVASLRYQTGLLLPTDAGTPLSGTTLTQLPLAPESAP